jgi:hypothetical protein
MFPTGFGEFPTAAPCWSIGDNGAAIILAPAADGLKRITVTPANDDEVAALLAGAGKTN